MIIMQKLYKLRFVLINNVNCKRYEQNVMNVDEIDFLSFSIFVSLAHSRIFLVFSPKREHVSARVAYWFLINDFPRIRGDKTAIPGPPGASLSIGEINTRIPLFLCLMPLSFFGGIARDRLKMFAKTRFSFLIPTKSPVKSYQFEKSIDRYVTALSFSLLTQVAVTTKVHKLISSTILKQGNFSRLRA